MKRRQFLKIAGLFCLIGSSFPLADALGERPFRPVLIWDPRRCIGCRACMAACQMKRDSSPETNVLWVHSVAKGRFPEAHVDFRQEICRECTEAPCLAACRHKALRRTPEGVILVDQERCIGEGRCVAACPEKGLILAEGKAQKCDLCLDLVRRGELPRCVAVCPSGALIYGDLHQPEGPLAVILAAHPELRQALSKYSKVDFTVGSFGKPYLRPRAQRVCLLQEDARLVYTVCLACNARCGLRVWVRGEEIVRVEGNPYHPYNRAGRSIPYKTPLKESLLETGGICAKPLFDRDYLNNPYRLRMPLKRNGPRGSGKFVPISWEQLIREVAEGGRLFAHLGDERHYPGLKEVLSDEPLDPEAPELGPRRNQLVWITGRSQGGRKHFIKRFVQQAVGSINYIGHTDICGLGFRMGNFAFSDGREVEFKADLWEAKYIIVFGANLYAALQPGPTTAGSILAERAAAGEVKFVIIDPRAHEATAGAAEWVPVRPGKDGALALGLLRVLLEEGLFDGEFLAIPNLKAAKEKGRNVFTNATHLVIVDGQKAGRFLRTKDVPELSGDPEAPVVVGEGGQLFSAEEVSSAKLSWQGKVAGLQVKTAFLLFKESVLAHELSFYAKESGVSAETIRRLAREFARHAPKSAAFAYHGGGNYVGGAYASYAIALLNALVGNVNRKGGYLCPGGGAAKWQTGLYDLQEFPGTQRPCGVKISREKAAYEKTTEFKKRGYPSRLPWFPFTKGGLSVSALSGIDQAYPYPIKILFTYFYNPIYTVPGGHRFIKTLKDQQKIPLHVSIDVTVNETNLYADYIVPDVTYLEGQYGFLTPHAPAQKFTAVRTPVVNPKTERTKDGRPFCLETFLIDLAMYLGLPGFGPKAIPGRGRLLPLLKAEDYYLRGMANLAQNAKVPMASEDEGLFVEQNYPVAAHRRLLTPEEWRRVCTVLARGGVFYPNEAAFEAQGNLKKGIPKVCLWNEKLARSVNSLTGRRFWGTVRYEVARNLAGSRIDELDADYPLVLISHKTALHTQSRTICYRQALVYEGEPRLLVNLRDAEVLGLFDGDLVRLSSRSFPKGVKVRVKISPLVRPGCVAYPFHYGHTQHGASVLEVPGGEKAFLGGRGLFFGVRLRPDPSRGIGINPNLLSRLDESLFNLPLVDPLGGIPDFSSTQVRIEKI